MKHVSTNDITCAQVTTFLQYIGDNTDHNISTIDGKNAYHGLPSISVANRNFRKISVQRKVLPRDKKENWSSIASNEGIPNKVVPPSRYNSFEQSHIEARHW